MIAAIGVAVCIAMAASACGSTGSSSGTSTAQTAEAGSSSSESSTSSSTGDSGDQNGPGNGQAQDGSTEDAPDGQGGPGNGQAPDGKGGPGNGQTPDGKGGGADTQSYDYTGETTGVLTADGKSVTSDSETKAADTKDQNAALAKNGGTLTITKGKLTKSGDDTDGDNCNFYGLNSILLAIGEKTKAYVSDTTLTADSQGSNAIFATDNSTVYASGDTINTTNDNSRGLDATYGGTVIADSMTIHTKGDHSASVATDRGSGNISVTNSKLHTEGSGSPLLYSTGDIQADNVTGTASGSQIAGMEGYNKIFINNSKLTSTITSKTASDPVANGVIIYQSMSGDADTSKGESALFQAADSTLTSSIEEGSFFYVTNTTAKVVLSNTKINYDADKANLLTVEGNDSNGWGTAGENGGTLTFTALDEDLEGNISVDTISSLDLYLLDGTSYTGSMEITGNEKNTNASDVPITVNISSDSTWVVTKDTTISALNAESGAKIVDEDGKTVTIKADGKTVVKGDSDITVTVTGSYSTKVSTSDANELSTDTIDRSDFDSYYGTSTTFGKN